MFIRQVSIYIFQRQREDHSVEQSIGGKQQGKRKLEERACHMRQYHKGRTEIQTRRLVLDVKIIRFAFGDILACEHRKVYT